MMEEKNEWNRTSFRKEQKLKLNNLKKWEFKKIQQMNFGRVYEGL